jgi:hypothetical protein
MLKQLAFAAIGSAALLAAVASANAGGKCGPEACLTNGTQLIGIADQASTDSDRLEWFGGCDEWGCGTNGPQVDGRAVEAEQPAVNAIILTSGEVFAVR